MTGQRFGRLTVIEFVPNKSRRSYWMCRCDCGNEKIISKIALENKSTNSCGCLQKEKRKELGLSLGKRYGIKKLSYGKASFNCIFSRYKNRAKNKKIDFSITEVFFEKLTKTNCYYCNCIPNQQSFFPKTNGVYVYNGIDRIDSSKGYTEDNVVPCCWWCNIMKRHYGQEEFLNHIKRIYEHQHLERMVEQDDLGS